MKGLHRVVVSVKDLDKAMHMFKTLLGGRWEDMGIVQGGLARAAWGLEAGVELTSPVDLNDDSPIAQSMRMMKCNVPGYAGGQGLLAAFFNVDDVGQADARAKAAGVTHHPVDAWRRIIIPSYESPEWDDPTSPFHNASGMKKAMRAFKQTVYDELTFNPRDCFGTLMGIGRFDPPVDSGVHRVVILAKEANMSRLPNLYRELLGGQWHDLGLLEDGKVRALWNLQAGMEVFSPTAPGYWADLLKEHGEGLLTVFFNVKDLEKTAARAKALGLKESRRTSIPGYKSPAWNDPDNPLNKTMPMLKKAVTESKVTKYEQIMYLPDQSCGMGFGIGCYERES